MCPRTSGDVMHVRHFKNFRRLIFATAMYGTIFLINDYSVKAQERSLDTTATVSVHPATVKPKKIKKRRAVYKLQSQSLAEALGLNKQQSDTLEVLYRETRKSRKLAVSRIPKEDMAAYKAKAEEINAAERGKLGIALRSIMTEDQAAEAMPILGGFNPHWDTYVFVVSTFGLEKEKRSAALQLVLRYIATSERAQKGSKSGGSRSSANLKASLDAGLAPLLTIDQMAEWMESTGRTKKENEVLHDEPPRSQNPRKSSSIKEPKDPFNPTRKNDPSRTSIRSRIH
jgi:hypothetical protein